GLDLLRRVRALNVDRYPAPVREHRAVYLSDRRGGHRLGLELEEEAVERLAELLADDPLDVGEREWPNVVLERAQLGDDVRRDDVRTGREQLPELHERGAELV